MLLWQDFAVMDRLHGSMIVVLVDLLINSGGDILMFCRCDCLVLYSRSYTLMDGGVVVAGFAHEGTDCLLCFIHVD